MTFARHDGNEQKRLAMRQPPQYPTDVELRRVIVHPLARFEPRARVHCCFELRCFGARLRGVGGEASGGWGRQGVPCFSSM